MSDNPIYNQIFNKVLSKTDPEKTHKLTLVALKASHQVKMTSPYAYAMFSKPTSKLQTQALGLTFDTPLGLAAGYDTNGSSIDALAALGYGAIEVGTVTGKPQTGNPKPRLFQLPKDKAIVNRIGYENVGAAKVQENLKQRLAQPHNKQVKVGVNIGKAKRATLKDSAKDLMISTRLLAPYADYLTLNLNTLVAENRAEGLKILQHLLRAIQVEAGTIANKAVPLCIKLVSDSSDDDIKRIANLAAEIDIQGIITVNTTLTRDNLKTPTQEILACGTGELSGPVLAERAIEVIELLKHENGDTLDIISVGGIQTAEDIKYRLDAGAKLVQSYSAMVYEGPLWVKRTNATLGKLLTSS
ncbi:MAG: quinone-dependent dihydroorotate dehydrogenase [Micrococcaceae bacterium]